MITAFQPCCHIRKARPSRRNISKFPRRTNANAALEKVMLDLSSRCDRAAAAALLLFAVGAMVGCQTLSGGGSSSTGTGAISGSLAVTPTSINFGSVQVGSTLSHSETLTNTGGSPLQISTATVAGTGFATRGLSLPTSLNAGQSLTFNLTFTPSIAAAATGSLAVTTNGSPTTLSVALSGTGASPGQLAITPTMVNFGNVTVGATQTQTETLTANGAGVIISSASSSNTEFTLGGLSLPMTLTADQSVSFNVTFAPQASGAASGTITFTSGATNPSVTESVTGTGMPSPQHSVSLSWTASTSRVIGYNVYRGTQSGGPYTAITTAPDASTAYTDSTVFAGSTYYYVVTAVDSSGHESAYSNQAQAVIPMR